ncbi:MAG: hypothetical protein ABI364_01760 [Caldimonas sp.]
MARIVQKGRPIATTAPGELMRKSLIVLPFLPIAASVAHAQAAP